MDDASKSLWDRVCATVNRWGSPRPPRLPVLIETTPATVLDLHGYTVHDAFYATKAFLSRPNAPRVLTVITGRSGRISHEFMDWLFQFPRVQSCTQLNGGGAYEIRLKP